MQEWEIIRSSAAQQQLSSFSWPQMPPQAKQGPPRTSLRLIFTASAPGNTEPATHPKGMNSSSKRIAVKNFPRQPKIHGVQQPGVEAAGGVQDQDRHVEIFYFIGVFFKLYEFTPMMKLYRLLPFPASWGRMPRLTDFCRIKRCENCLEMSSANSHSPSTASQWLWFPPKKSFCAFLSLQSQLCPSLFPTKPWNRAGGTNFWLSFPYSTKTTFNTKTTFKKLPIT